jgi:hypothetical protein
MNNIYRIFILEAVLFFAWSLSAQTEWTGPKITFTKAGSADWTLEDNQDRMTSNVWITRANTMAIFNIAQESSYQQNANISPVDTEWAFGNLSDGIGNLTFTTWDTTYAGNGGPSSLINQDMVVHLITDDIYIDIKFLSWGNSGQGAPFSYERSTNNLSTTGFDSVTNLKLYPNPSTNVVAIDGLVRSTRYELYNILGRVVKSGTVANNQKLNVRNLSNGTYFFKLENSATLKFIKQ